jgi:hypothetical protein
MPFRHAYNQPCKRPSLCAKDSARIHRIAPVHTMHPCVFVISQRASAHGHHVSFITQYQIHIPPTGKAEPRGTSRRRVQCECARYDMKTAYIDDGGIGSGPHECAEDRGRRLKKKGKRQMDRQTDEMTRKESGPAHSDNRKYIQICNSIRKRRASMPQKTGQSTFLDASKCA